MTRRADLPRTRRDFHDARGVLLVLRDPPPAPPPAKGQPAMVPGNPAEGPEILVAVWDDGSVTALHGHVDLGTGIRTALAQIAAEELDVAMGCVNMVLGDTARAPNQGATIASASIQIHAVPLRQAAATARAWLLEQAAAALQRPPDRLDVRHGTVRVRGEPEHRIGFGELLRDRHVELKLDPEAPLKSPADYRVVGQSVPRVDIPAKATGELVFVHDMRVPGMLHGRVVRPPYAGVDAGDFVGNTLEAVDESTIAHLPGIVKVVVIRDFVGVVAEREEQAEAAMRTLKVSWKPWPGLRSLDDVEHALRTNPATKRVLVEQGDVDAALAGAAQPMPRSYVWPYQMHAAIGPSCALADWQGGPAATLTVWAGTQNPHVLRADLARLTDLPDTAIDVVRMEAAGCYGRNCADDVAADAALLSRAVGRPVRVQLTREQEHAWEPKGAAQLMQIDGGLNADGSIAAYDFQTSYPSNGAPTLALLLTGTIAPDAAAYEMGDRTAVPPYDYMPLRVAANDMAPILRASWLRGVSALPNSFAHESYIDELATAAGVDPVAYRLRHLKDPRAAELVQATADRAGWIAHAKPQQQLAHGDILKGQGFAYARYVHSKFPGFGAAWAAWVADVEVNRRTGEVHVSRVVVGHDAGLMVNPAGVQQQVHGNVLQTTSRALKERVRTDATTHAVASRDWGSYPILNFREVPVVEVLLMPRPGEAPLGAGESASVPGTAAIANAIFDATGVRFRNPPFTPEVVRAALNPLPAPERATPVAAAHAPPPPFDAPWPAGKRWWVRAGALAAGALSLGAATLGWRTAIAPIAKPDASIYTAATIERGRQLAAFGDCVVCHTAPGGVANAGGREMETPFGSIVTTNLTPDVATGIGAWPFAAFQRAMREGISRDGRHLYPAFPYTAFAKTSDDDLMALYAYLMAQPAVRHEVAPAQLAFPFSVRPLMAMWNALYLDTAPPAQDTARSALWNRGNYLVNGLGHCGACHTPRNAFGAEQGGRAFLAGAMVEGWEAPPLTTLSHAPVPWSEDELFRYLRFGHTQQHGVAAGPMAPVVRELATVPEADVRAMAHYLASFNAPATNDPAALAHTWVATSRAQEATLPGAAQRLFTGACGACHHDGDGPATLGPNLPLALNSNLHSTRPDNLLRVILAGIRQPATRDVGFMPAFRDALDDQQLAELAAYMRARFAPGKPPWQGLEAAAARARADRAGEP
ncbi:molybdopterin cofactor-binding domain-containing protein [Piscinibacter sp.]|uniref:molybdopterin cofactor-binding domain-containing protein n=1 Tax=Piscinibacter sp. TaxID=1903157 RepID=UPI002C6792D1|nr:molybdopterin cofactor-binding domain-containing protein [Albitalea sp.]HUG21419.1 molybdopterin cofactor-binding domain-containing protein [Albitalea sp.]